jgi:methionyl-tRNA formyltransferase
MSIVKLPKRRLRLAFFGTPTLAQHILQAILDKDKDDVVLVVCQPDKPKGRKKKLQAPPVKELALAQGIEIIQPRKMRDGSLASTLATRNLDLAIVIAYGRILTADTLESIPAGFWNIHTSLLPRHRGASPIQHAIWTGDHESGVSLMQMTKGCDEGPVLATARTVLSPDENCDSLSKCLVELSITLLLQSLKQAKNEGLTAIEQDHAAASHARLLCKQDGELNFNETAEVLCRKIRALNPWPGTFVRLSDGQALKILEVKVHHRHFEAKAGVIGQIEKGLWVQTGQGVLEILQVQAPGKKPMACADYLRGAGRHWQTGQVLGTT